MRSFVVAEIACSSLIRLDPGIAKNVEIEEIRQAESDNRAPRATLGKLWTFLGCGLRNMKGEMSFSTHGMLT